MGEVNSLAHQLSVPKGEDTMILYNRNTRGLNSSLWAPRFYLTTVESTLWAVERGTFTSDRDIGEIFMNFMLSDEVRSFCGVDVTNLRTEEKCEMHRDGGW